MSPNEARLEKKREIEAAHSGVVLQLDDRENFIAEKNIAEPYEFGYVVGIRPRHGRETETLQLLCENFRWLRSTVDWVPTISLPARNIAHVAPTVV